MNVQQFLIFCFILASNICIAQTQLGTDIYGHTSYDKAGSAVAISADGNIVAVASPNVNYPGIYNDLPTTPGKVRVYEFLSGSWVQLGADIIGQNLMDQFGYSLAISADGTRLVVGAPFNDNAGTDAGEVRVFDFVNNNWVQVGQEISGTAATDNTGYFVTMTPNGNQIVVSDWRNDDWANNAGRVRIFDFVNGNWEQKGNNINGAASNYNAGISTAISADGNRVAIGQTGWNSFSGLVQLYDWQNNNWQLNSTIYGENAYGQFGRSVCLTADGNTLFAGDIGNHNGVSGAGRISIYEIDQGVLNTLNFIGGAWDQIGKSISISADGTKVSVNAGGATAADFEIRIFDYKNQSLIEIENTIEVTEETGASAQKQALSANGNRIVVGGGSNSFNGTVAGRAHVYQFGFPDLESDDSCFTLNEDTDSNQFVLEGDFTNCNIFILDANENVIQFLLNIYDKITVNIDDLPAGLHFIRVEHQQYPELSIQKIIKEN